MGHQVRYPQLGRIALIAVLRYPAIPHGIAALGWSTLFVAVGAIGGYGLVPGKVGKRQANWPRADNLKRHQEYSRTPLPKASFG